jgi:serine/threonine protein kinase
MSPERAQQIERLFHEASSRPEAERSAFLAAACAGDEKLRAELQALLDQLDTVDGLDGTGHKDASNQSSAWRVPEMLGVYRVENPIGQGGMGVVYRAFDTRLNRPVAIKFLADTLADRTRGADFSARRKPRPRSIIRTS